MPLGLLLIALPYAVLAKPPNTTKERVPTLQEVIETEGWTATPTAADLYAPGAVLLPNARGTHELAAEHCFAGEPRVERQSQSLLGKALRAGVTSSFVAGSQAASARHSALLEALDLELRTVPLHERALTRECVELLDRATTTQDLRAARVITDVLVATLRVPPCPPEESTLKPKSAGPDNHGDAECRPDGGAQVPVGFISVALSTVYAGAPTADGGRVAGSSGYALRTVPAGAYVIGCTTGQGAECALDEKPPRTIALRRDVLMGETEVTQGLYTKVMGSNPAKFSSCGPNCPVEQVSWHEAVAFANALSAAEGREACYVLKGRSVAWPKGGDCHGYRLPTEAEWEVAARGGQDNKYAGPGALHPLAWFNGNSHGETHPVGQKAPNGYGLSDMSGNVWEWTWDRYDAHAGHARRQSAPYRVLRGGSWGFNARFARVSKRYFYAPDARHAYLGLRLARTAP